MERILKKLFKATSGSALPPQGTAGRWQRARPAAAPHRGATPAPAHPPPPPGGLCPEREKDPSHRKKLFLQLWGRWGHPASLPTTFPLPGS